MAQKFANARWVKEGYFDNRVPGLVVGQVTFAVLGTVDFCLAGGLSGEIEGKVIRFCNPAFLDDPRAADSLDDFDVPQIGKASLLSFDPHPLLPPHPYFEWFSLHQQHYRIELKPDEAWILTEPESESVTGVSQRIHQELFSLLTPQQS